VTADPALERVRAAIRRLDGELTVAELRRCQPRLAADPWYQTVAEYVARRLWQPGPGPHGRPDPVTGLAVGPLQQVLRWLLREEIEQATRLFLQGRFAETRRVCEHAARVDGHCAELALLRCMAMVREEPDRWPTLLEARRWLTVAATDPTLQEQCRQAAEALDDLLARRERDELERLTEQYVTLRRVYNRPLYRVEMQNMRASMVNLGGEIRRALDQCRPGTLTARSLEALGQAVSTDIAELRRLLRL
jgi:hypothetical protein